MAPIPVEISLETERLFKEFARRSPAKTVWSTIQARARDPQLPDHALVASKLSVLVSPQRLAQSMAAVAPRVRMIQTDRGPSLEVDTAASELWEFAGTLSDQQREALDILLLRALHAPMALSTWPREAIFDESECELLERLESRAVRALSNGQTSSFLHWATDYQGYACIIVKVTRLCNLRCDYCHDWRAGQGNRMPFGVQARLFQSLLQHGGYDVIDVVWHGGEPTLVGRQTFLKALALQDHFRRSGQLIRNRLQTNGTRLNSVWIGFLERYRFQVSVSIDGPEGTHNATRVDVAGRPTFDKVLAGIRVLRDAELLDQVLVVVTPDLVAAGAGQLMAFLREQRLTRVGLLPVRRSAGRTDPDTESLAVSTYADFLLQVHQNRLQHPDPWIEVREIDESLQALKGGRAGHCEVLGGCVGHFFSVDPDGSVAHCDKFVGDPGYVLGNVNRDSFTSIAKSAAVRRIEGNNRRAAIRWEACPYLHVCHGWCPHERYVAEQRAQPDVELCCGLKPLLIGLARLEGLPSLQKNDSHNGNCQIGDRSNG